MHQTLYLNTPGHVKTQADHYGNNFSVCPPLNYCTFCCEIHQMDNKTSTWHFVSILLTWINFNSKVKNEIDRDIGLKNVISIYALLFTLFDNLKPNPVSVNIRI